MKIQDVENGFAGLLLRVDSNGTSLVFDNMQSQKTEGLQSPTGMKVLKINEFLHKMIDLFLVAMTPGTKLITDAKHQQLLPKST